MITIARLHLEEENHIIVDKLHVRPKKKEKKKKLGCAYRLNSHGVRLIGA